MPSDNTSQISDMITAMREPRSEKRITRRSLRVSISFLQVLFYTALLVKSMALIGQAQTLTNTCDNIEALLKLSRTNSSKHKSALLDAMQLCDNTDGKNSLDEEDYIVITRFLHLRAFVTQEVADTVRSTKETIRNTALKAYLQFVEYFDWLRERSPEELAEIVKSPLGGTSRNQIFSAASGLGSAALSAHSAGGNEDYNACVQYELLDTEWLNPAALNQWLANLVYPNDPNPVNDALFNSLNDEVIKAKMQTADWRQRWINFRDVLQQDKLRARDYRDRAAVYDAFAKRICVLLGSNCDAKSPSSTP
jgi:hypothetical protein